MPVAVNFHRINLPVSPDYTKQRFRGIEGSKHRSIVNGKIHNKKPKHKCQDCGRQFVESPTKKYVTPTILNYIHKMLLGKIPLAGIARVTGASKKWLQEYVNALYNNVSQQLELTSKPLGKLTIELVRKTLSFSKKLENHIGASWYFIHHYNASLQA